MRENGGQALPEEEGQEAWNKEMDILIDNKL